MPDSLEIWFYSALVCHGVGVALWLGRRFGSSRGFFVFALAALTAALVQIARTHGQWPVFELFESLLAVAWLIQAWLTVRPLDPWKAVNPKAWAAAEVAVLLVICIFLDKVPAGSRFNHTYPWVIGFHGFRLTSLAALLAASAYFTAGRRKLKTRAAAASSTLHQGRNFMLLAAVLFLAAEYTGLVWCQNGWGDIWHWSPGFFQSTLILLYLMAAFHVPGKIAQARRIRTFLGVMGGFFVLGMMLLRSLI